jgi:double-stranded uracil-DNA glycosylase
MRVNSFPPVACSEARVLILGSMPGVASLAAGQYYAQPRNRFWPIIAELLAFDREAPYAERLEALIAHRIALWDVLASCQRPGSLDASIRRASALPNDFPAFFAHHPRIRQVFFNGKAAAELYQRLVLPTLVDRVPALRYTVLPSTSPANAGITPPDKLAAWRVVSRAC